MRVAHFDCFSGISGDMTLGALIDAGVESAAIRDGLDSLGLPITVSVTREKRCGFAATRVLVDAPHEHVHRHLPEIERILSSGSLTERQRDLALRIFRKLAEAEAEVHDCPIEKVHFHEVGALDSIADIAGVAIGLDLLGVERITCRSVPPGSGTISGAHGIMPVPAPATAKLLQGMPLATAPVRTELVTPTGAAILATVVETFTDQPEMTVERIGCGAGSKDFAEQPNILRLLVGTSENQSEHDHVWVLETNLDDVPGEVIGYTTERLFAAGALDVYTIAIQMKKSRPGVLLGVIVEESHRVAVEDVLFRETGTFGVRRHRAERSKLRRESCTLTTPWGTIKAKRGYRPGQPDSVVIVTPEYEDCARVARERGVPLREIYDTIRGMESNP